MSVWFADSHYYLALLNRHDQDHERAIQFSRRAKSIVTTQWVLMEVGDGLAAPNRRPRFVQLLNTIATRTDVEIVPASDELFRRATALYAERLDKDWSLTDCTSFVAMQLRGLRAALTADHHFEQAGFVALLK